VDDFWVNVAPAFKGKSFKSITRSNIDLDQIAPKPESAQAKEKEERQEPIDPLIAVLKEIYGEQVRDVRVTHKLKDSALCLAVEEGAMDIRFERFLREQKQLSATYAKIVEINPENAIVQALARKVAQGKTASDEAVRDTALLLLDQAKIVEGEEITDPAAFARRMNQVLAHIHRNEALR
jgi:molecular chaperone HtpG